MAEYVNKNAAVSIVSAMSRNADCDCIKRRLEKAAKRISLLHSVDVVPVVRCRDCKHWGDHVPFAGKRLGFLWCDKFCNNIVVESDYCSYGELRDGGDPDGR